MADSRARVQDFFGWTAQPEQQNMQQQTGGQGTGDAEGGDGDGDAGDGLDDLLGDEEGDGDGDAGEGDSGGDGDGSGGGAFDEDALLAKVESRIDKRMNAVLREIRKGQAPAGKTGKEGEGKVADATAVREARMAFRESLPDEMRFISGEERRAATELGRTMILARSAAGFEDPDVVGQEVAQEVAKTIKGLRKHYEEKTKAALRRRGLLPEQKGGQGNTDGRANQPGFASQMKAGAALAASRHPQRTQQ